MFCPVHTGIAGDLMPKSTVTRDTHNSSETGKLEMFQRLSQALYWEWHPGLNCFCFHGSVLPSIWKPVALPHGEIDVSLIEPADRPLVRQKFNSIFSNDVPEPFTFEARASKRAPKTSYMLCAGAKSDTDPITISGIIKDVSATTLLAERAQSAEEKLLDAIESLRDGFVIYDSDDRLVVCNQRYRDFYPRSAHAMKPGATFTEILNAGLAAGEYTAAVGREEEWLRERLAQHQKSDLEVEQQLADGRWLRIAERTTPDGRRIGLRIDITRLKTNEAELKAALTKLEKSEFEARRLSVVADRTKSMVVILNTQGQVEWVNPAFTDITDYRIEDIAGKDPRPILRGADTDKSVIESVDRDIEHGKPVSGTILHYKKNGEPIWVEFERQAIRDDNGDVTQHMIVSHDVTERVVAADVLAERAESIRAILDTVVDAIITIDSSGTILTFNPAAERMFGTGREKVLGQNVSTLMTGKHRTDHSRYIARYLTGRTKNVIGKNREFTAQKADGTIFPIELAVGEMFVGKSLRFVGIIRDITERKQLERIKREFISTVSHELKTPLTSITGALGLARSGAVGTLTEQMQNIIDIAYRNSERLGVLVTDILDIEKIDAGQMSYEMQACDIGGLIAECVAGMQPFASEFGVSIEVASVAEEPTFTGDPGRITQVISNLLSNAVKFSKSGQHVEVGSLSTKDVMMFTVKDYGEGIPEALQERIFTRFFRVDSADDRHSSGTGLGLSICRPIAEAHGGTLTVESGLGEGSIFTVRIPRSPKI